MIKVFPDIDALNEFAAQKFIEIARDAIAERGRCKVALAGGSTPKALYRLLAGERFRDSLDWRKVLFFFGDERHVPPDNAESNFRMAHETLFQPLKIPKKNIYRWITEAEHAEVIADDYETEIWKVFTEYGLHTGIHGDDEPVFDLILLGMGADGHTASLFPFTEALHETDKIAVENYVEKLNTTRLTFTFPVINKARKVMFLVAGEEKANALREVLEGNFDPERFPAQNVRPKDGEIFWLLDENVAKLLKTDGN